MDRGPTGQLQADAGHRSPRAACGSFKAIGWAAFLAAFIAAGLPALGRGAAATSEFPPPGLRPLPPGDLLGKFRAAPVPLDLPGSLDWRDANIITAAKNQGASCGACWAFAAIGCVESMCLLHNPPASVSIDLSEQYPVSCDRFPLWGPNTNDGCCGGSVVVFEFLKQNEAWTEAQFPYGSGDHLGSRDCDGDGQPEPFNTVPCPDPEPPLSGWQVTSWNMLSANQVASIVEMKAGLQQGPVWLGYYVYPDFYTYWSAGNQVPYQHTGGGSLVGGHAVLLIGYNDDPGYWIAKNSWGLTGPWGDGTFQVDYDDNCSFGINAAAITIDGEDPPTATQPTSWSRIRSAFR